MTRGERWAALDVETANSFARSVCSIGVATVTADGERVDREWLVKPPGNRYDEENTEIHGISAEDTKEAPTFPEVWAEVSEVIAGASLIFHNAEFDVGCIRAAMRHYKQEEPKLSPLGCTLRMAHLVWPQRTKNYRLGTLCAEHGIAIDAHKAASDAAATLAFSEVLVKAWGQGSLCELRTASNRGHKGRSEAAMKRVAGVAPGPPSERQIAFLSDLLGERSIEPDSIVPHVRTRSQMSQLLDAILEGERPEELDSPQALQRYGAWLERTASRVLEASPAAARPSRQMRLAQGFWRRLWRALWD